LNLRRLFQGPTGDLLPFSIPGKTPGGRGDGVPPEGKTGPTPSPLSSLLPPPVGVGGAVPVPVPVAVVPTPAPRGWAG
jgi:hypothetical protein